MKNGIFQIQLPILKGLEKLIQTAALSPKKNREVGAVSSFLYPWHKGKLVYIQELFVTSCFTQTGATLPLCTCL